jgi:hypothetical protein
MKLAREFIQLPRLFDADRLENEVDRLPSSCWMFHPDGFRGNAAVPLISWNGEDNNLFDGPMRPTAHLSACPYVRQVIASFGEIVGRSRLMRLDAGCVVPLHCDTNYHWHSRVRIHVPVTTSQQVVFFCGDQQVHMAAGECWIFDNWRPHRVENNSAEPRVHLVIDTSGSSRFWKLVDDSLSSASTARCAFEYVPYRESSRPSKIRTERVTAAPVLPPGEVEALVSEIIRDINVVAKENGDGQEYARQLLHFCREWRARWHLNGTGGLGDYRELLASSQTQLAAMAPLRLPNGVLVCDVFAQLIGSAAVGRGRALQAKADRG